MLTTLLAFAFVIGVLVFVHELGHFLAARRVGVRVLAVFDRFRSTVCWASPAAAPTTRSRHPARRLRENGRRDGRGPAQRRSPTSSCRRASGSASRCSSPGPAMNIGLAVWSSWVVLLQGADIPAYRDMPPVVGSLEADAPAEQGRAGARRPHPVGGRSCDRPPGTSSVMTIAGKARREVSLLVDRHGQQLTSARGADGRRQVRDRRHRRAAEHPSAHPVGRRRRPGREGRPQGRRRRSCRSTAQTVSSARQLSEADQQARGPRDRRARRPQRADPRVRGHADQTRARSLAPLASRISDQVSASSPGVFEALQDERGSRTGRRRGLIFRTLGGLFTGETSPQAADGSGGHRVAVGRVGAGRHSFRCSACWPRSA